MKIQNKTVIGILIVIAVYILLIGAQIGWNWAGGDGVVVHQPNVVRILEGGGTIDRVGALRPVVPGTDVARGEWIRTDEGSRVIFDVGQTGISIAMDERTDIRIESSTEKNVTLRLGRGRIVAVAKDQPLTIATNHTQSTLQDGTISFVNYDFQSRVSILPIKGSASTRIDQEEPFNITTGTDIHEVTPISMTLFPFDLKKSSATDFYQWADKSFIDE